MKPTHKAIFTTLALGACILTAACDREAGSQTSAAAVRSTSSMPFFPASATDVSYNADCGQDCYEYLRFTADRRSVDQFTLQLLGFVPNGRASDFRWRNDDGLPWWPDVMPKPTRTGTQNQDNRGERRVLIVDKGDLSEVWVFAAAFHADER